MNCFPHYVRAEKHRRKISFLCMVHTGLSHQCHECWMEMFWKDTPNPWGCLLLLVLLLLLLQISSFCSFPPPRISTHCSVPSLILLPDQHPLIPHCLAWRADAIPYAWSRISNQNFIIINDCKSFHILHFAFVENFKHSLILSLGSGMCNNPPWSISWQLLHNRFHNSWNHFLKELNSHHIYYCY